MDGLYTGLVAKKPAKSASEGPVLSRSKAGGAVAAVPELAPRPITAGAVIGHERPFSVLFSAMRSGRVHHAWIFQGPTGVGKLTAAVSFASLLLDPTTQATFSGELAADPESSTQRLLASGTHPDLHVVAKELAKFHDEKKIRDSKQTSISVDVVRDFVIEPAKLGPTLRTESAAGKVFIIDDADLMNGAAQNAVLKTMEEPAARTVLILVTSSDERLLPTIRSRSQRVYFSPLSDADMRRWISGSGKAIAETIAPDQLPWLVKFSSGAPGVLALAAKTGLGAWWTTLWPMLEATREGAFVPEMGTTMAKLVDGWATAWVEDHDNASKEAANKAGADWMYRLVAHFAREGLMSAAKKGDPGPWLAILDAVRASESETDANVNLAFVMDKLAGEMTLAFETALSR